MLNRLEEIRLKQKIRKKSLLLTYVMMKIEKFLMKKLKNFASLEQDIENKMEAQKVENPYDNQNKIEEDSDEDAQDE